MPDRSEVEGMRVLWPQGTRIVLDSTDDPYTDLRPGSVNPIRSANRRTATFTVVSGSPDWRRDRKSVV